MSRYEPSQQSVCTVYQVPWVGEWYDIRYTLWQNATDLSLGMQGMNSVRRVSSACTTARFSTISTNTSSLALPLGGDESAS